MELVTLARDDFLANRPQTQPHHTLIELPIMRFMVVSLALKLAEDRGKNDQFAPLLVHQPDEGRWVHRFVVTQPARLWTLRPLTVVGFFGIKKPDANLPLAQALDRSLLPELSEYEDLLAYVSVCLPTLNFANLVLFASPQGKETWGRSALHAEAVRQLTPDFYEFVRLYNGSLPDGIHAPDSLSLDLVKYYDYGSTPVWRAVRTLKSEPA